ncbi:MAG: hypothetical protein WDM92_05940 [Caulobacteraceae bacterium]
MVILPRFDAEAVMRAIQDHRVTHMFLPPTALYSMLAHPRVPRVRLFQPEVLPPRRLAGCPPTS